MKYKKSTRIVGHDRELIGEKQIVSDFKFMSVSTAHLKCSKRKLERHCLSGSPQVGKLWVSSKPFKAFLWSWISVKVILLISFKSI